MIHGANECAYAAARDAEVSQILVRFSFTQVHQFTFDLGADHNRFGREVVPSVLLDRSNMRGRRVVAELAGPGVMLRRSATVRDQVCRKRSEIGFGDVARKKGWL